MVALILDGEKMGGWKGDYVFLVEWKIGRITQVSPLTNRPYQRLDSQTAAKGRSWNVWYSGHLSVQ